MTAASNSEARKRNARGRNDPVEIVARALARQMTDDEWYRAASAYRYMHRMTAVDVVAALRAEGLLT